MSIFLITLTLSFNSQCNLGIVFWCYSMQIVRRCNELHVTINHGKSKKQISLKDGKKKKLLKLEKVFLLTLNLPLPYFSPSGVENLSRVISVGCMNPIRMLLDVEIEPSIPSFQF